MNNFNILYEQLERSLTSQLNMYVFFDECLEPWIDDKDNITTRKKSLMLTITKDNTDICKENLNYIFQNGGAFIIRNVDTIYICENTGFSVVASDYKIYDENLKCDILELIESDKRKGLSPHDLYKDYVISLDDFIEKYDYYIIGLFPSSKLNLSVGDTGVHKTVVNSFVNQLKTFIDLKMDVKLKIFQLRTLQQYDVYISDGVIYYSHAIYNTFKTIQHIKSFEYTDEVAKEFNLMNVI